MELKFAATARPNKATADVQRRQKLVRRICLLYTSDAADE